MALSTAQKQEIIKKYQKDGQDTGSTEVQVALLTADILSLTEHMKANHKDHHSRRGLLNKVNKRRSLLKYLKNKDIQRYQDLIASLGLRK